jgi:hypothetical protein
LAKRPCGIAPFATLASWEAISNVKLHKFPKTRDCQSIAGFLLNKQCKRTQKTRKEKMNTKLRRVPTSFGPETHFDLSPGPPAPFRVEQESLFEALKHRLLADRLQELWSPENNSQVRRAANEAAALAWVTPYPLLFFPALFQEKTETALEISERHHNIQERSCQLLAL